MRHARLSPVAVPVAITILALLLRCVRPGLYLYIWDEVNLLFRSYRLAQFGDWLWHSNQTSWTLIPWHSPINNYLLALPYLVSSSPLLPRLMVGVLGALAALLVYATVRRYAGAWPGIAAGLLFAVAVPAVDWSRYVWNPNLGQVFIAAWMWFGLRGYVEGQRRARVMSWLMLSIAIQTHPGNGFLMLPALALLVVGWTRRREHVLVDTLVGWGLALAVAIPWAIGLLLEPRSGAAAAVGSLLGEGGLSFSVVWDAFTDVASGIHFSTHIRAFAPELALPSWVDSLLVLQAAVSLGAAAFYLVRFAAARGRGAVLPPFLALIALAPLLMYAVSPVDVQSFYLLPTLFGAMPLQALVLAELYRAHRLGRVLAAGLLAVWLGLHLWLNVANLRLLDTRSWVQPLRASLDTFTTLIDDWGRAADEVMILVDTPTDKYVLPDMQQQFWTLLRDGRRVRIVNRFHGQGVPLSDRTTLVVGLQDSPTLDAFFGPGTPTGLMADGRYAFRTVTTFGNDLLRATLRPETARCFVNAACIEGIHASAPPSPGQEWPFTVIWTPQRTVADANYQFSIRLVGPDDARYGQIDFPALDLSLWREGDRVFNPATLAVDPGLPPGADWRVQVLMYRLSDMGTADAVDDSGALSPWLYLSQ